MSRNRKFVLFGCGTIVGIFVLVIVLAVVVGIAADRETAPEREVGSGSTVTNSAPSTETRPPTQSPIPTEIPNAWIFRPGTPDPITGSRKPFVATGGRMVSKDEHAILYKNPTLIIRCNLQVLGKMQVYANWGGRFLAEDVRSESITTWIKVDERGAIKLEGSGSTDNEAVFLPDPREVVRSLLDGNQVVIRVRNFDEQEMTAAFPIVGLHHAIEDLHCY